MDNSPLKRDKFLFSYEDLHLQVISQPNVWRSDTMGDLGSGHGMVWASVYEIVRAGLTTRMDRQKGAFATSYHRKDSSCLIPNIIHPPKKTYNPPVVTKFVRKATDRAQAKNAYVQIWRYIQKYSKLCLSPFTCHPIESETSVHVGHGVKQSTCGTYRKYKRLRVCKPGFLI